MVNCGRFCWIARVSLRGAILHGHAAKFLFAFLVLPSLFVTPVDAGVVSYGFFAGYSGGFTSEYETWILVPGFQSYGIAGKLTKVVIDGHGQSTFIWGVNNPTDSWLSFGAVLYTGMDVEGLSFRELYTSEVLDGGIVEPGEGFWRDLQIPIDFYDRETTDPSDLAVFNSEGADFRYFWHLRTYVDEGLEVSFSAFSGIHSGTVEYHYDPVPEPGVFGLTLAGLLLFGVGRRLIRRSRQNL